MSDGKVYLYVNWREPVGGGQAYKLITPEFLTTAGWLPDIPDALAKKCEEARLSANRPAVHGGYPNWWESPKEAELDAFLAKNPDLDKYIKDFLATLDPKDAQKYGAYIKRRFVAEPKSQYGNCVYAWDDLVKLSKLRDTALQSEWDWVFTMTETLGYERGYHGRSEDLSDQWNRIGPRSDTVICLDAATGKTLWKKAFPVDMEVYKGARDVHVGWFDVCGVCATPAIWNGKCYAAGAMGLYCLSVKDGSLLWQAKTPMAHSSPLVANGIVFQCNSAFNAETGKFLWTIPDWKGFGGAKHDSPALWASGGKNYVISANGHHGANNWCCLDMETGKVLWNMDAGASAFGFPVINGDIMVISEPNQPRKMQAYKLSPTGATLLWSKKSIRDGEGVYAVWRDYAYFFYADGLGGRAKVECLDVKTGDSKWISEKYTDCTTPQAQSIAADGKMFNVIGKDDGSWGACHRGDVHTNKMEMIAANPDGKYVRLGKFDPEMCPLSSPALANGRLYLRLEKCVACYDLQAAQN